MIVKLFYSVLYFAEKTGNEFVKLNSFRIIVRLVRIILPIYYKVFPSKKLGVTERKANNAEKKVIVSLTTFPPRMKYLWIVLETILRQTRKPDKIILWLAKSQFPSSESIDKKVLKMKERGLEICFCDDIKSHKKYYYAMKNYKDDIIITVDDDIFQPEDLVENLMAKHAKYPKSVICYRAHHITFDDEGDIKKYNDWIYESPGHVGPSLLLMATNGAGALYPPDCLSEEVYNLDSILKLCPNADDIWLKCMGYLKGTSTVKVFGNYPRLLLIKDASKTGLAKKNIHNGENDIQLKKIMNYYDIKF